MSDATQARHDARPRERAKHVLERIDDVRWRVPKIGRMRVEGLIFADDLLVQDIRDDPSVDQVANVAQLPGIVGKSMAMPDVHWGYGFPIGGVAAFDAEHGVISPGGVGYDINCGVRLLATPLTREGPPPRARTPPPTPAPPAPSTVSSWRPRGGWAPRATTCARTRTSCGRS